MTDLLKQIEEKVNPKYLIYAAKDSFVLYKDIDMEESTISPSHIENKVFEVIDVHKDPSVTLYLIGVDNNELGWLKTENPILFLNSMPNKVTLLNENKNNELNILLGINEDLNCETLYESKYICKYNNNLYVGLVNREEFLGFRDIKDIDFGHIKSIEFSFNDSMTNIFLSNELIESQTVISEGQKYVTEKIFLKSNLGVVKLGKKEYWFKLDETDIDEKKIEKVEKNYEEYYLEHLIQSIRIDKTLKVQGQRAHSSVNKEYLANLNERMNQLKQKNEEHLEINRKTNYELREKKMESQRKESKLDYLNRLTENQKKKIEYYEERNQKLEARIELLEGKLDNINNQYKKLKESPWNKVQAKFIRK